MFQYEGRSTADTDTNGDGIGFDGFTFDAFNFDPESRYDLDLTLELQGALAGFEDNTIGRIYGSFNMPGEENPSQSVEDLTLAQFFSLIPDTINFESEKFDALIDLTNVSLDQALLGIQDGLQAAIDDGGIAYREIPFINKKRG